MRGRGAPYKFVRVRHLVRLHAQIDEYEQQGADERHQAEGNEPEQVHPVRRRGVGDRRQRKAEPDVGGAQQDGVRNAQPHGAHGVFQGNFQGVPLFRGTVQNADARKGKHADEVGDPIAGKGETDTKQRRQKRNGEREKGRLFALDVAGTVIPFQKRAPRISLLLQDGDQPHGAHEKGVPRKQTADTDGKNGRYVH